MRRFATVVAAVLASVGAAVPAVAGTKVEAARTCTWVANQRVIKIGSNPVGEWISFSKNVCGFSYRAHVRCNNTGQTFWKNGPAEVGGTWSKVNCSPAFMDRGGYQWFGTDGKWHTKSLPV